MPPSGHSFVGQQRIAGSGTVFQARNPATGEVLERRYGSVAAADIDQACALANQASEEYAGTSPLQRSRFLEDIADNIAGLASTIVPTACAETGLARARIEGELVRTVSQLRLFAAEVRAGLWQEARIDTALPDRAPVPRPDLRLRMIPLGPVVIFGASNFPLAFSVAGGDTASALAAGCPVIVKAHPAHPATSELVGGAICKAVANAKLAEGVFSLLFGVGDDLGSALVGHPAVKAVGFTGSRAGGLALGRIAAQRPEPIPVYAEMSSVNPVLLLPGALAERGAQLGREFVASLTLGAGQFCTNPGLLFARAGPGLDAFMGAASGELRAAPAGVMLHGGILDAYEQSVARHAAVEGIDLVERGKSGEGRAAAAMFVTHADTFAADPELAAEIFGSAAMLVHYDTEDRLARLLRRLEGQLTVTIQMTDVDRPVFARLLPLLERKAGRILINGWPTGVEVSHAMAHGGPYPATSDSRATSVGTLAMRRFLRPVCYQNFDPALLPPDLGDDNPNNIWRRVDGHMAAPFVR